MSNNEKIVNQNLIYQFKSPPQLYEKNKLQEQNICSLSLEEKKPSQNFQKNIQPMQMIDKDQLYETFILFQNFMLMNNKNQKLQSPKKQPNQTTQNNSTKNALTKEETTVNDTLEKSGSKKPRNFDDIPVKINNQNFIELVEKTLANDQSSFKQSGELDQSKIKKVVDKKNYGGYKGNIHHSPYYSDVISASRVKKGRPTSLLKSFNAKRPKDITKSLRGSTINNSKKSLKKTYETISKSLRKSSIEQGLNERENFKTEPNFMQKSQNLNNINLNSLKGLFKDERAETEPSQKVARIRINRNKIKRSSSEEIMSNLSLDKCGTTGTKEEIDPSTLNERKGSHDLYITVSTINKDNSEENYMQKTKENLNLVKEAEPKVSEKVPQSIKLKNEKKTSWELEKQIQKYKKDNEVLTALKNKYDQLHLNLDKDIEDLNQSKNEFENWRRNEIRKINESKKKLLQEQKQLQSEKGLTEQLHQQVKQQEKEIEQLKLKMQKMQKNQKLKENQYIQTIETLKKFIDENILRKQEKQIEQLNKSEKSLHNKQIIKMHKAKTLGSISQGGNLYKKPQLQKNLTQTRNISPLRKSDYDFALPPKYHSGKTKIINKEKSEGGKMISIYEDGHREITFPSGVKKEIFDDGYQVVYFTNGDIKQIYPGEEKMVYYFSEAETVQTTFKNGLQVFKFNNGQIEKHYKNGKKEIYFTDGSLRVIDPDETETTFYVDGSYQKVNSKGEVIEEKIRKKST